MKITDVDGIDGPFDEAVDKAMAERIAQRIVSRDALLLYLLALVRRGNLAADAAPIVADLLRIAVRGGLTHAAEWDRATVEKARAWLRRAGYPVPG